MSDEPEVWNVMTMKDGVVSLLKNLSEDEARAAMQRLLGGDPWSQEAIHHQVLASQPQNINQLQQHMYRQASAGWGVQRCECWGSLGGELEVWPKPADYDARQAEARRVTALIKSTNAAVDQARAKRAAWLLSASPAARVGTRVATLQLRDELLMDKSNDH